MLGLFSHLGALLHPYSLPLLYNHHIASKVFDVGFHLILLLPLIRGVLNYLFVHQRILDYGSYLNLLFVEVPYIHLIHDKALHILSFLFHLDEFPVFYIELFQPTIVLIVHSIRGHNHNLLLLLLHKENHRNRLLNEYYLRYLPSFLLVHL